MSLQPQKPGRWDEPSSWAGIGLMIFGSIFGAQNPELADPTFWGAVATVGAGVVSIIKRERR